MNQRIVNEEEFYSLHDSLKENNRTIIRCIEISGKEELKSYLLVWMD